MNNQMFFKMHIKILICLVFSLPLVSQADYLNPTKSSDCSVLFDIFEPDIKKSRLLQSVPKRIANIIGKRLGAPEIPLGSTCELSSAVTSVGSRIVLGMHSEALSRLQNTMAAFNGNGAKFASTKHYNSKNPRPTYRQAQRVKDLNSKINQIAQHVVKQDYKLSLGEKSAVVGTYANILTKLVKAKANGEIRIPLAGFTSILATTYLVKQLKKQHAYAFNNLRSQRLAALRVVEKKVAKKRRKNRKIVAKNKRIAIENKKITTAKKRRLAAKNKRDREKARMDNLQAITSSAVGYIEIERATEEKRATQYKIDREKVRMENLQTITSVIVEYM